MERLTCRAQDEAATGSTGGHGMRGLDRRLSVLETGSGDDLSPAVKSWLGGPITEAEQAALNYDVDTGNIDTSKLSREARAWLGID
jgi:hypothetical protein